MEPDEITAVLVRAHDTAYRMEFAELANFLLDRLGRLTIARIAGTPDPDTVSRWAARRTHPQEARVDRLRHAGYACHALIEFGFSPPSIRQWFRGSHPSLGDEAPMDTLARNDYFRTIRAVRDHARTLNRPAAVTLSGAPKGRAVEAPPQPANPTAVATPDDPAGPAPRVPNAASRPYTLTRSMLLPKRPRRFTPIRRISARDFTTDLDTTPA